ncbi:MAG: HD domain-containing protein [Deltaproteobacteria bacterium]|nr:HD domain-containing protein [Deltaproteobacteria bacterium]
MTIPPTPEACWALLDAHRVPPHIGRHSALVALLARRLAEELSSRAGETLSAPRLEAAGLLHDIAKAGCIETHGDHAREGGQLLRSLGHPEIAGLVERHVDLGAWDPQGPVTEAELLNYADKRVRHEDVVSLRDRFDDLVERYGGASDKARGRIEQNRCVMEALEVKIFARLPFGPEALLDWAR